MSLTVLPGLANAQSDDKRLALTRATLALQQTLLLTQEKLFPGAYDGLSIYLITPPAIFDNATLNVSIDSQEIIPATQLSGLAVTGNSVKLRTLPLATGKHALKADLQHNGKQHLKTLTFEKSNDRGNLDITIAPNADINLTYTTLRAEPEDQLTAMARQNNKNNQMPPGDEHDQAQLQLAGDYIRLGMTHEADALYRQLTNQPGTRRNIRDTAWLEQAKLLIQQSQPTAALDALANIKGNLGKAQIADYQAIKATAQITGNHIEQAMATLRTISADSSWALYRIFNLGVTLIGQNKNKNGALILHRIGKLDASGNPEIQAIIDQANLALGFSLLKLDKATQARDYLAKVHLDSHLSDLALLGMGWSYSIEANYEQALVFWLELQKRPYSSTYSYEAMLAVPYALNKATAYKQALEYYDSARERFNVDSNGLNDLQQKIASGVFKQLINAMPENENAWLEHWADTDTPTEKRFLPLFLDNGGFQTALMDYRMLLQLKIQIQTLQPEISKLGTSPIAANATETITRLQQRQQNLVQQTDQALAQQLDHLQQLASEIIKGYQTQLANYNKDIQFGSAQTIEHSFFKAGEAD